MHPIPIRSANLFHQEKSHGSAGGDLLRASLDKTPEMIRPGYVHIESCQQTVPEAIIAFLHSTGFENAIRISVSLGGDSDTLAAITGSIAEAEYGVPEDLKQQALSRLDEALAAVYQRFFTWPGGK